MSSPPAGPRAWVPLHRIGAAPTRARFVERPHRFAARCELASGELVEAHLPNPGRLTGTAAPGREVLLDGPLGDPRRSLQWTCLAMREPTAWVGTVTTAANRALPLLLEAGLLPELGAPTRLEPEVRHGHSRFDWRLTLPSGEPLWVEVKSATLGEGRTVSFPDAVTARGSRHLSELAELARAGDRCAVVFVAQRADVRAFRAAREIDPAFADALEAAAAAGVTILAASLRIGPRGMQVHRRLELALDP
ncbi:MAG: DNA/RNA nuclease SfsA [Deltaproteobacteria bacterium]|nr:DNA/RNA nuclease SfsA [Deltaproteobacteria bacterium]